MNSLEIYCNDSYKYKEEFKKAGCRWNPDKKAWFAPNREVMEAVYKTLEEIQEAEKTEGGVKYNRPPGMHSVDWDDAVEAMFGEDKAVLPVTKAEVGIVKKVTKEEVVAIAGEEQVKRYCHDDLPQEASEVLASGEVLGNKLYERLEDKGWKSRQVSLLVDVCEHFRNIK